jgi:hypothetical protein
MEDWSELRETSVLEKSRDLSSGYIQLYLPEREYANDS